MPPASRVKEHANCPSDGHGKPCCSHDVIGPAVQGSPDVIVNGQPVLRIKYAEIKKHRPSEGFCESFVLYNASKGTNCEKTFAEKHPKRYEILRKVDASPTPLN